MRGSRLSRSSGAVFLLVVMDVGVPGVPTLVPQLRPALQLDVDCDGPSGRGVEVDLRGDVFGASLHGDASRAPGDVYLEAAVRVEEGLARADL